MKRFLVSFFALTFAFSGFILAQDGIELIRNNGFDNGENNWELYVKNGGIADFDIDNTGKVTGANSAHVYIHNAFNQTPSGDIQLNQHSIIGGIEKGREYSISFKIKSTKTINNCYWTIYDEPDNGGLYYKYGWIKLKAGEVVSYSYNFTAKETDTTVYFAFDFAAFEDNNVELWIDDVHMLRIPDGEELISNNYFNDGIDGNSKPINWQLSAIDGGVATYDLNTSKIMSGDSCVHVHVVTAQHSTPSGRIQLTQHDLPIGLEKGEEYYLTFKIKSSKDINNFYWTLYDDPNGLATYYNWGHVPLEAGRVVLYSDSFVANATDSTIYLSFDFADFETNDVDIYIDDVHFIKIPNADELIKNNGFDNGAIDGVGIDWELSVSGEGDVTANIDDSWAIIGTNSQYLHVINAHNSIPSGRIQFRQKNNLPNGLEKGQKYKLSFKIKSSKNINNCFWTIYKEKDNLDDYYNWDYITLVAGQIISYNYTFTADTTVPNAYLSFDLADIEDDDVELWIDDVHFTKTDDIITPSETAWGGSTLPGNIPKPAYLDTVFYPDYGINIIRISDYYVFNAIKPGLINSRDERLKVHYSKDQAWNSDMSKLIVGDYYLLNANTFELEKCLHTQYVTTINDGRWSHQDPNIRYFCYGNVLNTLNIETDHVEKIKTFDGYQKIAIGPWEGNLSIDDKYVVIAESNGSKACLFDIPNKSIVSTHSFAGWTLDWASVSPLGNYIVAQIENAQGKKTVRYDLDFSNEKTFANEAEHGDFAIDSNGDEVFVQSLHLGMYKLNNPAAGKIPLLPPNYDHIGGHISGRASVVTHSMHGWALVSADLDKNQTFENSDYHTDLFEIKLDGSGTIRHFGHSGASVIDRDGNQPFYNSVYPMGCIRQDGKQVVFNSDWYHFGLGENEWGFGRAYIAEYVGGGNNKIAIGKNGKADMTWKLEQNYPNPFNPTTMINYTLPIDGMVKLSIYDILGQEVKVLINEHMRAGSYSTPFNGGNLSSGVYFYKLQSENNVQVKKMMLLK